MWGSKLTPLAMLHDSQPASWLSVPTSTRICFIPRALPIQRFVNIDDALTLCSLETCHTASSLAIAPSICQRRSSQ